MTYPHEKWAAAMRQQPGVWIELVGLPVGANVRRVSGGEFWPYARVVDGGAVSGVFEAETRQGAVWARWIGPMTMVAAERPERRVWPHGEWLAAMRRADGGWVELAGLPTSYVRDGQWLRPAAYRGAGVEAAVSDDGRVFARLGSGEKARASVWTQNLATVREKARYLYGEWLWCEQLSAELAGRLPDAEFETRVEAGRGMWVRWVG